MSDRPFAPAAGRATPLPTLPAWMWTALATAAAAVDLASHLFRDWVPHDEGALGLAGALVRGGAWPHRDFSDIYSGGLALLDAGTQLLLGDDLHALRIPLAIAALLWVPLLAACFRRFTSAPAAAGLALLAFLWGPPLYPAPIPSWYLLFLATGVTWCLFRWQETGRAAWWTAIGVLTGVALFLKINALFILAGAGGLLLVEAGTTGHREARATGPRAASAILAIPIGAGALGAAALAVHGWGWLQGALLVVPIAALALGGITALWRSPMTAGRGGRTLWAPLTALVAGLAVVLVPWVGAYWWAGATARLVEGLFILPFRRGDFAKVIPPTPMLATLAAVGALLALLLARPGRRLAHGAAVAILAVAAWAVWRARLDDTQVIPAVWGTIRLAAPALLLAGAVRVARAPEAVAPPLRAALWMAAWFALLQYPFGTPIYFAYTAPLLLVAVTGAVVEAGLPRAPAAALAIALAAWTLGTAHGQSLYMLGWRYHRPLPYVALTKPRGGLLVPVWEAAEYERIFGLLTAWEARTVVAGPDSPEVYYLGERPLPDREFFEFMAPEWSAAAFARRIVAHRPDAVVLNRRPGFSRVDVDSVVALLPWRPIADTTTGRFRLLRFAPAHASP